MIISRPSVKDMGSRRILRLECCSTAHGMSCDDDRHARGIQGRDIGNCMRCVGDLGFQSRTMEGTEVLVEFNCQCTRQLAADTDKTTTHQ